MRLFRVPGLAEMVDRERIHNMRRSYNSIFGSKWPVEPELVAPPNKYQLIIAMPHFIIEKNYKARYGLLNLYWVSRDIQDYLLEIDPRLKRNFMIALNGRTLGYSKNGVQNSLTWGAIKDCYSFFAAEDLGNNCEDF